jgi:hypothetical protein
MTWIILNLYRLSIISMVLNILYSFISSVLSASLSWF